MKMNKKIKKLAVLPFVIFAASLMQGCVEEEMPTSYATENQLTNSDKPAQRMLNGLNAMMVDQFTYNGDQVAYDWGYPCQIVLRDVLGGDEPVLGVYGNGTTGDYLYYIADNSYLTVFPLYTYAYYYDLIANANQVIKAYSNTDDGKAYAGVALAYRALAYLDLARMFEYKPTGFENDSKALNVMGLTVPIVTENTTMDEAKNNPRAPYYTMYRFIMNDLNTAEADLADYNRGTSKNLPDVSVIYGLKARLWLEMATRFNNTEDDLTLQLLHEKDNDGYAKLNISTAKECYAKADEYAKKAMACDGYSPVTQAQWHNSQTGFNTANQAWMWSASTGSKEMISYQWFTWTCWMAPESKTYSWAPYFDSYRGIDKALFDKINRNDWRKKTWVAPIDAGADKVPDGYSTILDDSQWKNLPAYAGLKFRLKYGNADNYEVGMLTDIPLMRVEEMYFIAAEAEAHTVGVEAGKAVLEDFMNNYRYTRKTYKCNATEMYEFITELMTQKRVEFWGEGLIFFDNKRLALQIKRYYDNSNYPSSYQINSKQGYVAPWLNYYIYDYERDNNQAVILNPDPSNTVKAQTDY